MICEQCALREDCRERETIGRHAASCEGFFPELSADRSPRAPMTPEAGRRPIQTRSEEEADG